MRIPFNRVCLPAGYAGYLAQAAEGSNYGDLSFSEHCERLLQKELSADRLYLTGSCSAALEVAAILSGAGPGDEVIVPAYTFPSTANPFLRQGASIRFLDSLKDGPLMDESLIEDLITSRTRVLVVMHYGGMACDMDTVAELARKYGLLVIEDAAHAYGATYRGRALGTIGDMGCLSFHSTKNIQCMEGGALVVQHPLSAENVEVLLDKGTDRQEFLRGNRERYGWKGYGSGYRLSELHAAMLLSQLSVAGEIVAARVDLWEAYMEGLSFMEESGVAALPRITPGAEHNGHIFYLVAESSELKEQLKEHLSALGIGVAEHFQALDSTPFWREHGASNEICINAASLSERLIRLPLYNSLSRPDQLMVINSLRTFFGQPLLECGETKAT